MSYIKHKKFEMFCFKFDEFVMFCAIVCIYILIMTAKRSLFLVVFCCFFSNFINKYKKNLIFENLNLALTLLCIRTQYDSGVKGTTIDIVY